MRQLLPGETLPPEAHLMEQLGESRPTLREAFRILESESLIGVRRGVCGGAQVLEPHSTTCGRWWSTSRRLVDAGYAAHPDLSRWSGTTYRVHELILQLRQHDACGAGGRCWPTSSRRTFS